MKPRILYDSFQKTIASNGLPIDTKKHFFFRCLLRQDLFLFNLIEHPKVEDNTIFRWLLFANREDSVKVKTLTEKCAEYLNKNHHHSIRELGGYPWGINLREVTSSDKYRFGNTSEIIEIRKVVREMVILPLLDIEFTGDIGYGVDL